MHLLPLRDHLSAETARLDRDDLWQWASAEHAASRVVSAIEGLPDGQYALSEVEHLMAQWRTAPEGADPAPGASLHDMSDEELLRMLFGLCRIRNGCLLRGSGDAFARYTVHVLDFEREYVRRLLIRVPVG